VTLNTGQEKEQQQKDQEGETRDERNDPSSRRPVQYIRTMQCWVIRFLELIRYNLAAIS